MDAPRNDAKTMENANTTNAPFVSLPLDSQNAPPPTKGLPTISTLPPIVTTRPPGSATTGSNIPVINGVRQPVMAPANSQFAPTVINLSTAPSAAGSHLLPPEIPTGSMPIPMPPSPPFYEFMDKCRYTAGFMLSYYLCTFFFLQPFVLGVMGILTGFLGYYGSRPPIFAAHAKWVRGYLWMNMAMVVINLWFLAITIFFLSSLSSVGEEGNQNEYTENKAEYEHIGIFVAIVIVLNLILHVRGIHTARRFHAEMLRAGTLPGFHPVVVLGHPV